MSTLTWQFIMDLTRDSLSAMPHILSSLGSNQLTHEFLDHCFEYLIAARLFDDILFAKLCQTFYHLMVALQQLVASLLEILFFFSVFVAKIAIVAFPYIYEISQNVYEFHVKNFSRRDIAIEVTFIVISTLLFVFRRRLKRQWSRFEKSLSKSSKSLAVLAPHILYVLVAIVIVVFAQKILKVLIRVNILSVVTLLVPVVSSLVYILRYYEHEGPLLKRQPPELRQGMKTSADFAEELELLRLWAVLGCYHAVAAFVSLLPMSTWVLQRLPYILEFVLITMVWLQLSHSFCRFVYAHFSLRLLHEVVRKVPLADLSQAAQLEYVISGLRYSGLVSELACTVLRGLLQDSLTFALILGFLFTPGFVASYGVILVAIVLPAYKSSLALAACTDEVLAGSSPTKKDKAAVLALTGGGSVKDVSPGGEAADRQEAGSSSSSNLAALLFSPFKSPSPASRKLAESKQRSEEARAKLRAMSMWLDYWVCFGLLWLLKLTVLRRVWPSMLLLAAGYLQHAYFMGCTAVVQSLLPWVSQVPWARQAREGPLPPQPAVIKDE